MTLFVERNSSIVHKKCVVFIFTITSVNVDRFFNNFTLAFRIATVHTHRFNSSFVCGSNFVNGPAKESFKLVRYICQ